MRFGGSREWRPCCGACRSERLDEHDAHGEHYLRCADCGAVWDGSELGPGEARDRPPRKRTAAVALLA